MLLAAVFDAAGLAALAPQQNSTKYMEKLKQIFNVGHPLYGEQQARRLRSRKDFLMSVSEEARDGYPL